MKTQNRLSTQVKKKKFIEALTHSLGVITPASDSVGLDRTTYYKWCEKDPEFKQQCDEIIEKAIDFVEYELFKQIKNGSVAATIFYLKTKGKGRGYIEQYNIQEVKPIEINYIIPDSEEKTKDINELEN